MSYNPNVIRAELCKFLEEQARELQRRIMSECLCRIIPRENAIECKLFLEPTKEDQHGLSVTSFDIYHNLGIEYKISYPNDSKYIEIKARWYTWENEILRV